MRLDGTASIAPMLEPAPDGWSRARSDALDGADSGRASRRRCARRFWSPPSPAGTTPPSAATAALEAVAASLDAEPSREIDPEEFFDFQVNRPTIRLTEGQARRDRLAGEHDAARARARAPSATSCCCRASSRTCAGAPSPTRSSTSPSGSGVEMVVTLGALIADVAHTRPVPITGLASDPELVERLGLSRSSYEGPTGIVGILHDACRRRGITSASLWAAVPHYVAAVPNPKAALALLRRLEGFTGIAVEASELEDAAEQFERAGRPRRRGRTPRSRSSSTPARGGSRTTSRARPRAATSPPATRSPRSSSASCAQRGGDEPDEPSALA